MIPSWKISLFVLSVLWLCLVLCGVASGLDGAPAHSSPALVPWRTAQALQGEALVRFHDGVALSDQEAVHAAVGAQKIEALTANLVRVRFDSSRFDLDEVLARYAADPRVAFAEPNLVFTLYGTPNDSTFVAQWGMKKINCPKAWNFCTGDPSVVIALIDTGVDMTHPDLKDHYAYGYDFFDNDPDPTDMAGHGSHTAGIAAAVTNNAIGVAGVSYGCHFASYRTGDYWLTDDAIISSVNDATAKGAHVISMSFGSSEPSAAIEEALNNAYAAGVVCVASAGNSGNTAKNYPAAYANVISVAASNSDDSRAYFSTYGNWVDVTAPGVGIVSTFKDGKYASLQGTSMSCPHVSGLAGLIYSQLGGVRTQAHADQIRSIIQDTAVPVGSWVIHGRIDALAAVMQLTVIHPPTIQSVTPAQVQAFHGGTITIKGTDLGSVTDLSSAGMPLKEGTGFTIQDSQTITYSAPKAPNLGLEDVTVTNPEGQSNTEHFTYVETSPVKCGAPFLIKEGSKCLWEIGGGANRSFLLLWGTDENVFPYQGFWVLSNFAIVDAGALDGVGYGSFQVTVPAGTYGTTLYSQAVTFGPGFLDISGSLITIILP